jgi:purine-nucleoside/S-methyl-5'-thioadenosine phosphorylase / adenosine deaminase
VVHQRAHPDGVVTWHFEFEARGGVLAATTTRHGGCSDGVYATLNLGYHVGDDPVRVARNRARLCDALGVEALTVADQQHGDTVAVVDTQLAGAGHASDGDAVDRLPATDALVTATAGVALAVLVADCAPVVLYDPVRPALGVAHVGRRGAVLDVLGRALDVMESAFGSERADIRAGVGPCIGSESYEIGGDAEVAARATFGTDLLRPTRPGHACFDLPAAVLLRLDDAGITRDHVEMSGVDTATCTEHLFSDRVQRPCGRMMLVAALR